MTPTAIELLPSLLQLTPDDRAELAAQLLNSLDTGTDESADEAWGEEIARRIEEVRRGRVKPVPWAEARAQILADDADGGR
ncbi:Addiction module component, family OS=Rhodopirellula europaea SH398 GN=RESH_04772 PE=4 SV=1: Unstab_antitox [Gemmataceae bacterium]|nr:Addiction module component, family OS=Rhodopirellula europaea SH398 GN=RESH_04772 PE=4 SV=1: Unstab_antitox [Gemmataceae bacterium]VTT97016.1 Addiction module component, family OS=Rhodopirellula europaea SH398 GN=RESH_04772 PE=4 SV=1: Unstab_antitox [Gemmataceae bacterium]